MKIVSDYRNRVYAVTASHDSRRGGFILTWITLASLHRTETKVLLVVSKFNATLELLEEGREFCLNLLSAGQLEEFCRLGLKSGREGDKFSDLDFQVSARGIELNGAAGVARGKVEQIFETPDRKILYCTLFDERVSKLPPMILEEALELIPAEELRSLRDKFERDSLRDENQFL